MTDYREINALQRDPPRARALTQYLLTLEQVQWSDWETDFLDTMSVIDSDLSTRQAEKLVELRDNTVVYKFVEGLSLRVLIENCYVYRDELSSEHDQEFLVRLKTAGGSFGSRKRNVSCVVLGPWVRSVRIKVGRSDRWAPRPSAVPCYLASGSTEPARGFRPSG
jgi:hypothetical protein